MKKIVFSGIAGLFILLLTGILSCSGPSAGDGQEQAADTVAVADAAADSSLITVQETTGNWKFVITGTGEFDEPISSVYYLSDGKEHLLKEGLMGTPAEIIRDDYPSYNIPSSALNACMAWWAGAGDVFYIVGSGSDLVAYHGEVGEGMDFSTDIKFVKLKVLK